MIVTMMDMKVAQTGPVYNPRIFGPYISIILSNQCPENKKTKKHMGHIDLEISTKKEAPSWIIPI